MEFKDETGRYFYHYKFWECWKYGLYKTNRKDETIINNCAKILQSVDFCDTAFSNVLVNWPISSKVHLSNKSINRQAWIGHASFCILHGANENEGIAAWWKCTKEQQDRANSIADFYIKKFEMEYMPNAKKIIGNKCFRRCERTYNMDF